MKCKNCGLSLPDDSVFCQYCGTNIEKSIPDTVQSEYCKSGLKSEKTSNNAVTDSVEQETNDINYNENSEKHDNKIITANDSKISTKKNDSFDKNDLKVHFSVKNLIITILSIVSAVAIGLYIYQFNVLSSQKNTISSQSSDILSKNNTIKSLRDQVANYEKKADMYDRLISALNKSSLGYASNNFHSSESVIIVSKNQKNRKFTLTANWSNGGSVTAHPQTFSPAAEVSFDNDNWNTSTSMTVKPIHEGVTTVKFSNDVDNRTFDVVIVVTE